jgi:hypothetical protein
MIRCLCLSLLLFGFPVLAADPPGPAKEVPELKPLANYVGKWSTESTLKFEGQPETSFKGQGAAEWIHDGRFVRQSWTIDGTKEMPGLNGSVIFTYDVEKKTYRGWNFMSNGFFSQSEGTFDPKTRTFTWTAHGSAGETTITKASFAEEGKEKWTIVTTDRAGKVLMDMRGTSTRRKE